MKAVLFMILLFFGLLALPARAGYDEAASAFNSKDYGTAYREFRALAEQGDAQTDDQLSKATRHGSSP